MKKNLYTGVFFIAISCLMFGLTVFLNVKENELANELNQKYTDVDADKIDSSNNGNLINVSGNISYEGEANDKEFNLNVDTAILKRNVEVFVWIQETETNNGKTTYTYRQKWMNELVDSSKFEIKDRYENPKSISYANKSFYADNVKLGVFKLDDKILEKLKTKELDLSNINLKKLPKGFNISGNYITNSKNIESPSVGDIRISYTYNTQKEITVFGEQDDETITEYETEDDNKILDVISGIKTGEEVVDTYKKSNYFRNNFFILTSLALSVIGIILLMKKE